MAPFESALVLTFEDRLQAADLTSRQDSRRIRIEGSIMSEHKACYGTMFHDSLHFSTNRPMRGKVFSFEIDTGGLARSDRRVSASLEEWDDCLECHEFDHCHKFSMAKLLLQTAIERE